MSAVLKNIATVLDEAAREGTPARLIVEAVEARPGVLSWTVSVVALDSSQVLLDPEFGETFLTATASTVEEAVDSIERLCGPTPRAPAVKEVRS